MKKLYFSLIFIFSVQIAFTQYYYIPPVPGVTGNPGGLNTSLEWPYAPPSSWTLIMGTSSASNWSGIWSLPFSFQFNGTIVTHFKVSNTGIVTFDTAASYVPTTADKSVLPNSKIPDKSICVWGVEMSGSNDNVITNTFGSAPNRQFWIQYSSVSIPNNASGWTYWSIVLEESTNRIYIVDQRTNGNPQLSLGVQIDSTWGISIPGSPNISGVASTDQVSDNIYYTFEPGIQGNYDILASRIVSPSNIILSPSHSPFDLSFEVFNLGSDSIHSVTVQYSDNGVVGSPQTISGLNLKTYDIDTLNLSISWSPTVGSHVIKMWVVNMNGTHLDQNPSNDTAVKEFHVASQMVPRKPMFELFTASTCSFCKPYNDAWDSLLLDNVKLITYLKYQYLYPGPGDPYYTAECGVRGIYYDINANPNGVMNGLTQYLGIFNIPDQNVLDDALNDTTYVWLTANRSMNSKTVDIDVEITPYAPLPPSGKLFVAIYENSTVNNATINGQTMFFHVMKKMVPDAFGIFVGSLDTIQTFNFSYTFNGSYRLPNGSTDAIDHTFEHSVENFNNLDIAVWIQDTISGEVIQSSFTSDGISIPEFDEPSVLIYPNPASEKLVISGIEPNETFSLQLINTAGQGVMSREITFNEQGEYVLMLNNFEKGIYILNLQSQRGNISRTLIVE